jgi:hypothetical protein
MAGRLPTGASDVKRPRLTGALPPELVRESQMRYDSGSVPYPQAPTSVASARFGGIPGHVLQASDRNETAMVSPEDSGEHFNGIKDFSSVQQRANGGGPIGYRYRPDDPVRRETEKFQVNINGLSMRSSGSPNNQVEAEWIEQFEPGVYLTLASLRDGTEELKRVRFRYPLLLRARNKVIFCC